jgi:hypothetical protein
MNAELQVNELTTNTEQAVGQTTEFERISIGDNPVAPNSRGTEGNSGHSGTRHSYEPRGETIRLEAALNLLPSSFSGEKPEETEIFLESCEFALTCAHDHIQPRLLLDSLAGRDGKILSGS